MLQCICLDHDPGLLGGSKIGLSEFLQFAAIWSDMKSRPSNRNWDLCLQTDQSTAPHWVGLDIWKSPLNLKISWKVFTTISNLRLNGNVTYHVPAPEGTLYRAWFLPHFAPSSIKIQIYIKYQASLNDGCGNGCVSSFEDEKILASLLSCVTDLEKFQVYL